MIVITYHERDTGPAPRVRAHRPPGQLSRCRAASCELTQPSVSQRIRELEAELRHQLFVRRGPRVSLTAEGHALVEYADRVLADRGEMVERFQTRDPLKGMLRLGLNESFALDLPAGPAAAAGAALSGHQDVGVRRRHGHGEPDARPAGARHRGRVGAQRRAARARGTDRPQPAGMVRARADFAIAREILSPLDLCRFHLIVSPPTARLHETVTRWFAEAGALRSASARATACR